MGSVPSKLTKTVALGFSPCTSSDDEDTLDLQSVEPSHERVIRQMMLIGIGEVGKRTLYEQLKLIYNHDISRHDYKQYMVWNYQYISQILLENMIQQTDIMRKHNQSLLPHHNPRLNQEQRLLISAFSLIQHFSDVPTSSMITNTSDLLAQFDGSTDTQRLVSALKYIWSKWPSVWHAWNQHWHQYRVDHELKYFFQALVDDPKIEAWLGEVKEIRGYIMTSDDIDELGYYYDYDYYSSVFEDMLEFRLDDFVRVRCKTTGVFSETYGKGPVKNIHCFTDVLPSLLDHWARVECDLKPDYWCHDLTAIISNFVGNLCPNYLVRFDHNNDDDEDRTQSSHTDIVSRSYKWTLVGSQRVERSKWYPYLPKINTFFYVSSLSNSACVLYEDESINSFSEDLRLFQWLISMNENHGWNSQAVLVFTKRDTLVKLIKSGVRLAGVWDDVLEDLSVGSSDVGGCAEISRVDYLSGPMDNEDWLDYCVDQTIKRIERLFMRVDGAKEFVKHMVVVDAWDTMDVANKLLSPEIFEIIN